LIPQRYIHITSVFMQLKRPFIKPNPLIICLKH
jgi:hypothetical protein